MKLIEAVNAYLAADEMSREKWPYAVSLAVVKVKRALKDEFDFFVEKERELIARYAVQDGRGNIRLTPEGRFVFRDPADGADYEQQRRELGETEITPTHKLVRVRAPEEIKPAHIEALDGFIEFTTEEGSL
jgi:hypothetical protein